MWITWWRRLSRYSCILTTFNRDSGFMLRWTWQLLLQQVWSTSNEIWGQTQHSSDSVHYLLGRIQLWTMLRYGYISRTDWVQVISQNNEDGDKVSLWRFRVFELSGTAVSQKRFIWSLFYVKALLLEFCTSVSCWFFKMVHPCCAWDSKDHRDSVAHSSSVIQYQPNNMFWSNGPLSGWQDWKTKYTILNWDGDLSLVHIFNINNRVEMRNFFGQVED